MAFVIRIRSSAWSLSMVGGLLIDRFWIHICDQLRIDRSSSIRNDSSFCLSIDTALKASLVGEVRSSLINRVGLLKSRYSPKPLVIVFCAFAIVATTKIDEKVIPAANVFNVEGRSLRIGFIAFTAMIVCSKKTILIWMLPCSPCGLEGATHQCSWTQRFLNEFEMSNIADV